MLTLSLDSSVRPTDLYRCALNSYGRPNLGKWLLRMYLHMRTSSLFMSPTKAGIQPHDNAFACCDDAGLGSPSN